MHARYRQAYIEEKQIDAVMSSRWIYLTLNGVHMHIQLLPNCKLPLNDAAAARQHTVFM
jgi:hypothetical protein